MDAKDFASCSHVSLLPDMNKCTFRNFFKYIFSSRNISHCELLNQSGYYEEHENKFLHKGMIYVSIFIQISLNYLSKPLNMFGTLLQDFLNRGVTQRESHKYISFLGQCDTNRLDLDKTIMRGDAKYYPVLTMMASKLAYENKAVIQMAVTQHWKMEFVEFYDFYNEFQHKTTTQAFIFREPNVDGDMIVVSFRGTSPFDADDWSTDFDFSWLKIDGMGKTHFGFMMALGLQKFSREYDDDDDFICGSWPTKIEQDSQKSLAYYTIREKLKEMMAKNPNAKIIVTGHSLGGALAILFPSVLALHGEVELFDKVEAIYTYGQPRVGDQEFGEFMKNNLRKHNIKYYRITYGYDMVPKVPLDDALMTFKHFAPCIRFNCFYEGKIVEEERERDGNIMLWLLKTIIVTIINFIVSRLSALWELIRGFFMGYVKGPDYREGWLFTFLRVIGVIFPGITNHFCTDYVNSTRLASEDLFKNYRALQE